MHRKKNGIILVAFGASTSSAQRALSDFEQQVQETYPHTTIRWAFTSPAVRNRMEKNKQKADSLEKVISQMASEKYTTVAIQSLHMLAGIEYEAMLNEVQKIVCTHSILAEVGRPLLWTEEDITQVANAVLDAIPKERLPEEAVLYMGHGTKHEQEKIYAHLATHISTKDPFVFIGTLEGKATITKLLPLLKSKKIKHVWLLPLLSLVGKHAQKDMAGSKKDSWKSILEHEGFTCTPVLKGLLESNGIATIWLKHLKQTVKKLSLSW